MVASLTSIMLIMTAINAQEQYALAAEDRCYNSKAKATGYEFSPPYDGEIIGIRLVHKSGLVTCVGGTANSYWGCGAFPTQIYVEMIKHDVTPITYYPTETTDGISGLQSISDCECSVYYYYLNGFDGRNSEFIELRDSNNLKQVSTLDTFSLQYGEGCCDYAAGDNAGTACADVYFIYNNIYTNEPSSDPTPTPSKTPTLSPTAYPTVSPTAYPTVSPTAYPTVSPTAYPTVSPTHILTKSPTKSPTNIPTLFPTYLPTDAPTFDDAEGQNTETDDDTDNIQVDKNANTIPVWIMFGLPAFVGAVLCILIVLLYVCWPQAPHSRKKDLNKTQAVQKNYRKGDLHSERPPDFVIPRADIIANDVEIANNAEIVLQPIGPQVSCAPGLNAVYDTAAVMQCSAKMTCGRDKTTENVTEEGDDDDLWNQEVRIEDNENYETHRGNTTAGNEDNSHKTKGASNCVDCGLLKAGRVYQGNQLFYCYDCLVSYGDVEEIYVEKMETNHIELANVADDSSSSDSLYDDQATTDAMDPQSMQNVINFMKTMVQ